MEPEQDPADVLLPADGEPAAVTHQKVKRLVGEIIFLLIESNYFQQVILVKSEANMC